MSVPAALRSRAGFLICYGAGCAPGRRFARSGTRLQARAGLSIAQQVRISVMAVATPVLQFMADSTQFDSADISSLRLVVTGATSVPEGLLKRYQTRGVSIVQGFGLTENSGTATLLAPSQSLTKLGFAGRPLPQTRIKIIGEDGLELPVGDA